MIYQSYDNAGDAFFRNLSNGALINHLFNTGDALRNEFNEFCYNATCSVPIEGCADALMAAFEDRDIPWVVAPGEFVLNSDGNATRKWLSELRSNYIFKMYGRSILHEMID